MTAAESPPAERVAVIGLGYVGLPVALGFARHYTTVGFDVATERIAELRAGNEHTLEVRPEDLRASALHVTDRIEDIAGRTFYVVAVPTPVDAHHQPDLSPVERACETVGRALRPGCDAIVCFESTVYPGVTEEICGPIIERLSGLKRGTDFRLAYSPERINPGDRQHTLETIVKVVSGEDAATLERVAQAYGRIVPAGVHRAATIRVAEAAKVIENTQRDINIALMNELALIFERMHIRTQDVLAAAATKWNFLKFQPGLVGGHCIGVDPYYLTSKAEELGYHPQVILAGRHINDDMGVWCAQRMVRTLIERDTLVRGARVGILGLTFKEDVPDLRNSRVPDIVRELQQFGVKVLAHDPLADAALVQHAYGIALEPALERFENLDGLMLAVAHRDYVGQPISAWTRRLKSRGVFADLKSVYAPADVTGDQLYWSL